MRNGNPHPVNPDGSGNAGPQELLWVAVPPCTPYRDRRGNGFFITAIELWTTETILNLRWNPPTRPDTEEPVILLTDEHGSICPWTGSTGVDDRILQHYALVPLSSRILTVSIPAPASSGNACSLPLFSCPTRFPANENGKVVAFPGTGHPQPRNE